MWLIGMVSLRINIISVKVPIIVMKHCDQKHLGKEEFIWLDFHIPVHCGKKLGQNHKQGRNLEARPHAEATEECWLAPHGFLWLLS